MAGLAVQTSKGLFTGSHIHWGKIHTHEHCRLRTEEVILTLQA